MAIPSKQIGWSNESNLLWQIARQIQQLTQVTSASGGGGGGGVTTIIAGTGISIDQPTGNVTISATGTAQVFPIKLTSQTLTQGSWTLVGAYYEYTFSNVNIDTTSDISVTPQNASYLTAYNAQILPFVAVAAGVATFYSNFPPADNMVVDIVITQTT